jgi:2-keto-3-deoxy-L-arabinonate dehydratase
MRIPCIGFTGSQRRGESVFGRDGRLDAGAMRAQVEHCIECGAAGITVLGLVTEVNKLDVNERLELVRVVGAAIGGRVP